MARPSFIIVGASRSGTTALHDLLASHESIFMPKAKELQFFSDDRKYRLGPEWYWRQFESQHRVKLRGEASPPYFHKGIVIGNRGEHRWTLKNDSVARAAALVPDAKIIISLRNPITRVQSQFWKNVWQGREWAKTLEQAMDEEMHGARDPWRTPYCWLYKNQYGTHVDRWLEFYPRERVAILIFEEWTTTPRAALKQLESFLELPNASLSERTISQRNAGRHLIHPVLRHISVIGDRLPFVRSVLRRVGTGSGYTKASLNTHRRLYDYFEPDVRILESRLGRSLELWGY